MTDIVERLRVGICYQQCRVKDTASGCECAEAAARIEQLEAALREIASNKQQRANCFCGACIQARHARAALGERT